MTAEAPFHLQRLRLPNKRHAIHSAMAGDAADPFLHVNAMIEVGEVGQVVHSPPGDRHPSPITLAYRLEHLAFGPDLIVTVHADFRGRHSREVRCFDRDMAVTAVNAQPTDVVLMAELDGLRTRDVNIRDIRGPEKSIQQQ